MKAFIVISILVFFTFKLSAQSAYHGSIGDGYAQASLTITVNESGLISTSNSVSLKAISLRRGERLPIEANKLLGYTNVVGQKIALESSDATLPYLLPNGLIFLLYLDEENKYKTLVINVL